MDNITNVPDNAIITDNSIKNNKPNTNNNPQLKEQGKTHSHFEHQKQLLSKLSIQTQLKTKRNKEYSLGEFFHKSRHYFIMTDGGLPVYSRYGDEIENNSIFATFSALITKYTIFLNESSHEQIHLISTTTTNIVFLKQRQLILIALNKKNDPLSLLISQLYFLFNQLMSLLTTQLYNRLLENPSKCLTALDGTDIIFEHLIKFTSNSFVSCLYSYNVLPLSSRDKINKICSTYITNAIVCVILTSNVICGLSIKPGFHISVYDIVLLQNYIHSSPRLRVSETWTPFCAPGLSEEMYLQLYIKYSQENIGICFLIDSSEENDFVKFSSNANLVYEELKQKGILVQIMKKESKRCMNKKKKKKHSDMEDDAIVEMMMMKLNQEVDDLESENIWNGVVYCVCNHLKLNQFFTVGFNGNYRVVDKEERSLMMEYVRLIDKYKESVVSDINTNNVNGIGMDGDYYHYEQSSTYVNAIYVKDEFMLIASFNFYIKYHYIHKQMKSILKHIHQSKQYYFIAI